VRRGILWCFFVSAVGAQTGDLHRDALVFDAHVHMINRQFYLGGDISERYRNGQVDLPRAREGGVDAMFFSIYPQEQYYPKRFEVKQTLRLMDLSLDQIEKNRSSIEIARKASDLERIARAGKIAAVLDIEGGFDLDGDLHVLRALYRFGLRSAMLPAHNYTNNFADYCCAPPKWNGINEKGRDVIREMNRLGMVINVAHGSDETIRQAVEASSDPVLFSHGGFRHFVDMPRSITDAAARAIASRGGVIAIQFGNSFSNPRYFEWRQKNRPAGLPGRTPPLEAAATIEEIDRQVGRRYPVEPAGVPDEIRMEMSQLVEVIDYAVRLVGEDHVALGSDFDGAVEPPRGMNDISHYPQLTAAMQRKGYSEPRIRKILGLNLLRLFRQVTEQ
jgi:membrane dipeptidase